MNRTQVQAALDTYPKAAPFWRTPEGQQALAFAAEHGMAPITYAQRAAEIEETL